MQHLRTPPLSSPAPAEWKWGSREAGKCLNLLERRVEEGKGLGTGRTKQEGVGGGGEAGVWSSFILVTSQAACLWESELKYILVCVSLTEGLIVIMFNYRIRFVVFSVWLETRIFAGGVKAVRILLTGRQSYIKTGSKSRLCAMTSGRK